MLPLDAQFRLASAWRVKGHLDRAAAGYRDILRVDPGHLPAALKLGDLLEAREELGEAETVFAKALRLHPNEATLHKRFIDVVVRGRGVDAAFAHYGLARQDARSIDLAPRGVLGCAVVRNERARLPYWLTYHRRMGVDRFFVVDNDSTDGTLPYLLDQPDVHVWRTAASYHEANYGTVWIELLLRRYGVGRWCLVADADELFCYPGCDDTPLPEFCRRLDAKGKRAVGAILLDMYALTPIRDTHYTPGEDFLAVCRYFDRRFSHRCVERWTIEGRQTIHVGGVRERVFGGGGDYYLSKVPLLRYDVACVLSPHWTNIPDSDVAVARGCVLHFKYFASFPTAVREEVARREHLGHLFQYEAYAERVADDPGLTLFDERHSVELRDVRQLVELGVMRADGEDAGPDAVFVQLRLANIWRAKGKLARALAGYREIVRTHPAYVPAQLELGEVLRQHGRLVEAAAHYRAAIVANPDEPSLQDRLAEVLALRAASPRPASVAPARPDTGTRRVLVYTDRSGAYGAEQIGHMLMLDLAARGYAVSCAQPPADHRLIDDRCDAGIEHVWLPDDGRQPDEVVSALAPDLVVFNDGTPLAHLAAKEAVVLRGIPYVLVTHCVSAAWAVESASQLPRLPPLFRTAAAVVAVSEENLALLRRHFGLPADVGEVIVNGRPDAYFAAPDAAGRRRLRAELGIPDDAVVALSVGRLELVKGHQYVIAAMKRLQQRPIWPRLYFAWAGKGTLEGQLCAVVAESGMEPQVRFLGERADVPELLDAADVFLLPSQFEGMPLALMEAMAKGVPPIATAVSGIPEAMGDAGRLLPNPAGDADGTVRELAATLEEWATHADRRRAVGRAARDRAAALFRGDRMLASYLALVERACGAA